MISDAHKIQSARGELGRGKEYRIPRSWLIRVRKLSRENGEPELAEACDIALRLQRGESDPRGEQHRRMRKLAGRRLS